jgi:hypothetical protein
MLCQYTSRQELPRPAGRQFPRPVPISTCHPSRSRAVTLLATVLLASAVGRAAGDTASGMPSTARVDAGTADVGALDGADLRVALVVEGHPVASATLADTAAARSLASALPLTVEMADRFGQAKAGRLPVGLADDDASPVVDPEAGHLYFWPPDGTIAVLTADVGPSVPRPGLVDLGVVDEGLDALGSGHERFDLTIEAAA